MTDHIEPALSSEEWAAAEIEGDASFSSESMVPMAIETEPHRLTIARANEEVDVLLEHAPAVIALLNAMLDPSDPRKITREWLSLLRNPHAGDCNMWALTDYPESGTCSCGDTQRLEAIADALAAYLPPEGT